MKTLVLIGAVLAGCGCSSFEGDRHQLTLSSSLAHQFMPWRPSTPLALGSTARFGVFRGFAASAADTRAFDATLDAGTALEAVRRAPDGGGWIEVRAIAEGQGHLAWSGAGSDDFDVQVRTAAHVGLSDPLLFYRDEWPQFVGFDGGSWPDVSDAIAAGAGARLAFEPWVRAADGTLLGADSDQLTARVTPADAGWQLVAKSPQVILQAPDAGTATLELGWGTGVSASIALRVARDDEAASVTLLEQPLQGGITTVGIKAVVLLADGSTFFGPHVVWAPDREMEEIDLTRLYPDQQLLPRSDARVYGLTYRTLGTWRSNVTATVGVVEASHVVERRVLASSGELDAPAAKGCAAAPGAAPLVSLALLALARRTRRHASGPSVGAEVRTDRQLTAP